MSQLFLIFLLNIFIISIKAIDYKFLESPNCVKEDEIEVAGLNIAIVVKSSSTHFRKRMAIRETWGSEYQLWPEVSIRTVFNLGLSNHSFYNDQISTESEVFQDIIQSDFLDTYFNNTLKTVMGINWAVKNCKYTEFFLFVDDDALVSVKHLVENIKSKKYTKDSKLYTGHIFETSKPFRNPSDKWYVSSKEFHGEFYPPFASGVVVLYSKTSLELILKEINRTELFRLDDVYIGIVAAKAKIVPENNPDFRIYNKLEISDLEGQKSVIASHLFGDIDEMVNMWNYLNRNGFA